MGFDMMGDGYGMMNAGWGLLSLVYFVLACFIFSVVFWWTHNWMAIQSKKKK